jgi:transposase InsO family protein
MRLRPCWPRHVRAYGFVQDRAHNGRRFRMLTVIDEYTRECLAIVVARRLSSDDVLQVLTNLFVERGPPEHVRSDNGPPRVRGEGGARLARPDHLRRADAGNTGSPPAPGPPAARG